MNSQQIIDVLSYDQHRTVVRMDEYRAKRENVQKERIKAAAEILRRRLCNCNEETILAAIARATTVIQGGGSVCRAVMIGERPEGEPA